MLSLTYTSIEAGYAESRAFLRMVEELRTGVIDKVEGVVVQSSVTRGLYKLDLSLTCSGEVDARIHRLDAEEEEYYVTCLDDPILDSISAKAYL